MPRSSAEVELAARMRGSPREQGAFVLKPDFRLECPSAAAPPLTAKWGRTKRVQLGLEWKQRRLGEQAGLVAGCHGLLCSSAEGLLTAIKSSGIACPTPLGMRA